MACSARRACAITWMIALVEQPIAIATVIAFRNASRLWIADGRRSSPTISTMRRPTCVAMRWWLASTAGIDDAPGKAMPSASAIAVIVLAVPIVMQVPWLRAMPPGSPPLVADQAGALVIPVLEGVRPEPSVLPAQLPRNIGPAGEDRRQVRWSRR